MTSTTVLPDRLAALDTITLDSGSHTNPESGMCSMEWVAWAAGLGFTDHPECASPVLGAFTRSLNDQWDTPTRQRLKPYLPRMVGTGGDGRDDVRSYMALDWLIRTYTPAWLDLAGLTAEAAELRALRRIVDQAAAEQAGPVVKSARTKATAAGAAGAAGDAAWDVARVAGDAVWAARVAGDAVWAAGAARDAAGAAAGAALRPTVETLQQSALDLLDRMITGEWDDEVAA